jgi:hypothetical protein
MKDKKKPFPGEIFSSIRNILDNKNKPFCRALALHHLDIHLLVKDAMSEIHRIKNKS